MSTSTTEYNRIISKEENQLTQPGASRRECQRTPCVYLCGASFTCIDQCSHFSGEVELLYHTRVSGVLKSEEAWCSETRPCGIRYELLSCSSIPHRWGITRTHSCTETEGFKVQHVVCFRTLDSTARRYSTAPSLVLCFILSVYFQIKQKPDLRTREAHGSLFTIDFSLK